MSTVDDIKAGKYELVALQWDQVLSKPGQPFDFKRHRRGDVIDLNVEDARRLVLAGAAVKAGEDPAKVITPGRSDSTAPGESSDQLPDPDENDKGAKPDTVEEILAAVGDDKTKALAALEAENARGDKARSTLVAELEKRSAAESG